MSVYMLARLEQVVKSNPRFESTCGLPVGIDGMAEDIVRLRRSSRLRIYSSCPCMLTLQCQPAQCGQSRTRRAR
jgi:hypothetical protein